MTELATERQIQYIIDLGGKPKQGLMKEEASELIQKLIKSAPPTQKQLQRLQKLGATIPDKLTSQQATELIDQLDGDQPPSKQQIRFIKMLGGDIPATKREASVLCERLESTALATEKQKKDAIELGKSLPDGCTFLRANELISAMESDADEEDGKPTTQAQVNKIIKLGGDPSIATTIWRAHDYISELEDMVEEQDSRADDALMDMYSEFTRELMTYRRPSRSIMIKALKYGDEQGWGKDWENPAEDGSRSPYDLMNEAINAVAPELLKNEQTLRAKKPSKKSGGRGCLIIVVLIVILVCAWVIWNSF